MRGRGRERAARSCARLRISRPNSNFLPGWMGGLDILLWMGWACGTRATAQRHMFTSSQAAGPVRHGSEAPRSGGRRFRWCPGVHLRDISSPSHKMNVI